MKSQPGVRMYLDPNSAPVFLQVEPELVDEGVFELEPSGSRRVTRVDDTNDGVGLAPGANPQRLALPHALPARSKDLERLLHETLRDANRHSRVPPRTALGRRSSLSCGLIPAS